MNDPAKATAANQQANQQQAEQYAKAQQQQALQSFQQYLQQNPNPASQWGPIQGPPGMYGGGGMGGFGGMMQGFPGMFPGMGQQSPGASQGWGGIGSAAAQAFANPQRQGPPQIPGRPPMQGRPIPGPGMGGGVNPGFMANPSKIVSPM